MTPDRGRTPSPEPSPEESPYYRDFATLYDEISRGVPGDIEFYVDLARRVGGTMVELGVGTGRIAIPAAQTGVRVIGIDREPAMLAIAAEKARQQRVLDRLTLIEGDMRTFSVAERVSLVSIPFRTFQHNLTVEDQRATLAACRDALHPGGILALNVFNPDVSLMERWTRRSAHHWAPYGRGDRAQQQHRDDSSASVLTTKLRVRSADGNWRTTSFRLRYVSRSEMELHFAESGFQVQSLAGDFAGQRFEGYSPEMVWTAVAG
ncbi:MAG: class I SAM-dependent methyltransferase [Dehalococcoidia bacterium]